MSNELDHLIQASLNEDAEVVALEVKPSLIENKSRFNHPVGVVVTWIFLVVVVLFSVLTPQFGDNELGVRSSDTRLGVSLYHLAHHIETHRAATGSLPDYLEPGWSDLKQIEYTKTDAGYELHGQIGAVKLRYRQGDDPELLLVQPSVSQ